MPVSTQALRKSSKLLLIATALYGAFCAFYIVSTVRLFSRVLAAYAVSPLQYPAFYGALAAMAPCYVIGAALGLLVKRLYAAAETDAEAAPTRLFGRLAPALLLAAFAAYAVYSAYRLIKLASDFAAMPRAMRGQLLGQTILPLAAALALYLIFYGLMIRWCAQALQGRMATPPAAAAVLLFLFSAAALLGAVLTALHIPMNSAQLSALMITPFALPFDGYATLWVCLAAVPAQILLGVGILAGRKN